MVLEVFLCICTLGIILLLFYYYLAWCDKYAEVAELYRYNPSMVSLDDRAVIEKYGGYMLPRYMSDTYKPIRFGILYRWARLTT